MSNIVIPIEKSTNATSSFSSNNLFQQDALNKIKLLINKNLKIASSYVYLSKNDNFDRYHNAITILGERGTGKTSFLLNLEKFFFDDNDKINKNIKTNVEFLESLDPTLFEDKQNILVSIITIIVDKVKDNNNNNNLQENKEWLECLTELSDGLNLLDGIGSNPMQKDIWDDSRIILDKGLVSAHSGINFEKNFHIFIDKSLKLLNNKKMFILKFDDIDTSVLKGWPVLEVIRKYLTTPKIQIIISGDINLFSKLIRLKQWENLEKLTIFEKKKNLLSTIDQLEEQYLTKILKPEYRIYLQNLESILNKHSNSIKIEYKENEKNIEEIYNEIAEKIFILERKKDKEIFINILLKLPIRTNIQIILTYYNNLYEKTDRDSFLLDFSLIFMTNFSKFDFKYEDTNTLVSNSENIISYLIDKLFFIKKTNQFNTIQELKSLQPIFKEKDLNLFLLYLNASVVNSISKSNSIIFSWYLKNFCFFKILEDYTNHEENELINYFDIKSSLIYTSSKINGILYEDKNDYDYFSKIYMQVRQAKKNSFEYGYDNYETKVKKDLKDTLPEVYKTIKLLENIIFVKIRTKNDAETHLTTSILNIFSFIGTILNPSKLTLTDKMKEGLEEKTIGKFEDNKQGDMILTSYETTFNTLPFYKDLEKWIELQKDLEPLSVQLIEDIWNEFHTHEKAMANVNNVAEYLELQIFIFLNSIVRVFIKHKNINISTQVIKSLYDKKNQFSAKTRFESNLNKYEMNKISKEKNFLDFMIECPLWKYLINYNKEFSFTYSLTDEETTSYYDYLKLLPLHQGSIIENNVDSLDVALSEEDESNWPDKALTKAKIRKTIIDNKIDLSMDNIEEFIWNKIKFQDKIKGTIDYSGRKERIQEVINEFIKKDE